MRAWMCVADADRCTLGPWRAVARSDSGTLAASRAAGSVGRAAEAAVDTWGPDVVVPVTRSELASPADIDVCPRFAVVAVVDKDGDTHYLGEQSWDARAVAVEGEAENEVGDPMRPTSMAEADPRWDKGAG